MSDDEVDRTGAEMLTIWDRRVVRAFAVVQQANRGALVLRVVAAIVALGALTGEIVSLVSAMRLADDQFGQDFDGQLIGQFLSGVATPLAFAAVVLALSYLVQLAAARLEVDIVVADDDRTAEEDQP